VKRTKAEIEADPEEEDEYGYTISECDLCAKCKIVETAIGETIERIVVFIYYLRHVRNQYSFYTIALLVASLTMVAKFNCSLHLRLSIYTFSEE